tara:strand:- start:23130 stop:23531 length:402 start_codon:yes stop_codon:yes gene_type:complete
MNEKQLQAKIVMAYSQDMFDFRGCLWSTRNTTFSVKDGQTQKAMGMVAGVSDLICFIEGHFIGIEVKVRGTSHSAKHLAKQLMWGETIIQQGGHWCIVTSLEEFWDAVDRKTVPYNVAKVKEMLAENKSTIKF